MLSHSIAETFKLAHAWVEYVSPQALLGLTGEMGSGKTVFVKGVADALAVSPMTAVTSPTFTVMHIYEGLQRLYHFDVYRLGGVKDIEDLGIDEYLSHTDAFIAVEWAEKLREFFPENYTWVQFQVMNESSRKITVTGFGTHAEMAEKLTQRFETA